MTLVFENDLVAPTLSLAVAYFALALYGSRRLIILHSTTPEMNTRKLFVISCLLTSILRFMSFITMTAFNYAEFHMEVRTDPKKIDDDFLATDEFFEKATIVLFDLPDFCVISAYMLLIVVCAEALIQSRRHWLSAVQFRRNWMVGYLVFNAILYTVQVLLYSLLFIPSVDQSILATMIYLTMTAINLVLPFLWIVGFLYLSIVFAGFPYASSEARARLNALVRMGGIWTVARLVWGFIALTSVVQGWLEYAQDSVHSYSFILISIFALTEILPIALGLQPSVVESLTDKVSPIFSSNKWQGGRVSAGGGGKSSSAIIVIGTRVPAHYDVSAGSAGTGAASSAASSLSTSSYVTSRSLSSHFAPSPPRPYSFPEAVSVPYSFSETTDVSVHMRQPLLSAQHTLPGGESSWECSRGTSRTSLSELNDASSSHSSIFKSSPDQPSPLRSASARSSGRDHVLGNNRYFAVPQPLGGAAYDSDDTEDDSNDDSTAAGRRGEGQRAKRKRSSAPTGVRAASTSRSASGIDPMTANGTTKSRSNTSAVAGTDDGAQSLRGRLVRKISGWLGY